MSQTMSNQTSGRHVLLTGANGFVASHILSLLLDVSTPSSPQSKFE